VAWAKSQSEFEGKVRRHTETLDRILVELENVQFLEFRMEQDDFPEELVRMRETAAVNVKTRFLEHFMFGIRGTRTEKPKH